MNNDVSEYRCGSRFAWSELFSFTTQPEGESVLRVAIYGDMGVENAHVWIIFSFKYVLLSLIGVTDTFALRLCVI